MSTSLFPDSQRAEGQPMVKSPSPQPTRSTQAPGGAPMAKAQTLKSPVAAPVAAPVAQPVGKPGSVGSSSKTLPASKSPPPNSSSPPIASSSLASFYGAGETGETTGGTKTALPQQSTGSTLAPPSLDTSGEEGATGPSSASAFYANLASQATPKEAKSESPMNAANMFLATAGGGSAASPPASPAHAPRRADSPVNVAAVPSILATIASKFENAPINLAASPKRVLIREGFLQRQATFKNVERYCYLFNDLFIVTEPVAKPAGGLSASSPAAHKLQMKQIVPLDQATLQPGKKPTIFIIDNPEKPLYFECSTITEADEWTTALRNAITDYKSCEKAGPKVPTKKPSDAIPGADETIFTAIQKKDDQLLMYILSERGDDSNQFDSQGFTPLHRCVLNGFLTGVSLLLGHDADPALVNPDGKSALHLAALNDEYAILLVFLSRKPNLDEFLDMDGRSPLWDLIQGPYKSNEKLQLENIEPNGPASTPMSKKGKVKRMFSSPLAAASPKSSRSSLQDSAGDSSDDDDADESEPSGSPLSPQEKDLRTRESIQRNSWKNLVECVTVMIDDCQVDLEHKDKTGRTLLMHLACMHQHEALKLLLGHGASLSLIDQHGSTVLHYAVSRDLSYGVVEEAELSDVIQTVQLILQKGVCPNLRDHEGNTPLHLCKSLPVAGCLIVHGARADLKNEAGVKAGAYFEELAAKGDPNDPLGAMREAREQWNSRPDTVLPPDEDLEANSWLNDELSDCCLLCSDRFSLTKRRHHCRRCGMLCCSNCSSKKFSNPRKNESGLRACDSCYNLMAQKHLKLARTQRRALAKRRAEQQQIEADKAQLNADFDASHKAFLRRSAEMEERNAQKAKDIAEMKANPDKPRAPPAKRLSATSGSSTSSTSSSTDPRSVSAKSDSANAQMHQNVRLAQERGEKLSRLEDKAQRMEDDAENFASMAAKLKQKQKDSWF